MRWVLTMSSRASRRRHFQALLLAVSCALTALAHVRSVYAQSTIKHPVARPPYHVELEPHLLVTPFDAPDAPSDGGYGVGVRATIELLPDGFLPTLNDSVGIGFGLDWVHYDLVAYRGACGRFEFVGPPQMRVPVCVDAGGGSSSYLYVPVVMQWNFWLHRRWSAFGEPGLAFSIRNGGGLGVSPDLSVGGRFHISDAVALSLRLGYPAVTFGVSFLF